MQGYSGFKKKKSTLGSTLTIVAVLHVVVAGGLVWLASTTVGREMLAVYKINVLNLPVPKPEPPPEAPQAEPPKPKPEPKPEQKVEEKAAPETAPEVEAPSEQEAAPTEVASIEAPAAEPVLDTPIDAGPPLPTVTDMPASGPIRLPGSGNPFAGGKAGRKFSGYTDLITSEIQKHYKQPGDLPGDLRLAVLFQLRLDEEGRLLEFKLVNSSGDARFDESALRAISNVKQLRPPPRGMSKTLTVKFFPPSG